MKTQTTTSNDGKALAQNIMNAIYGRAGVQINGEKVQCNSAKTKLYVGDNSIPVAQLQENLTEHELMELNNLPFWNGNNEYQISSKILCHISAAIKRANYNSTYDSTAGYDSGRIRDQEEKLAMCLCSGSECTKKRVDAENN